MPVKSSIFLLGMSVFFINPAHSAIGGWELKGGVAASESYNDNLTLVSANKIDDYITEINPYIGIRRKTRALDLSVDYRLQNLIYASEDQFNETFHQLQGDVTANFIKDIFYINGSASYGQQNISNTGNVSFNNQSVTGNRTNVGTARLNPYFKYRFGRAADLYLGVEKGIVRYGSGSANDSDRNDYQVKLSSGTSFNRIKWNVNYHNQDIETDGQSDTELTEYKGKVEYKLTRQFGLTATAGYEDNEYVRAVTTEAPDGSSWTIGINWTPSPRTSFEAGVGERFYGNTGYMTLSHRLRRVLLSAKYLEDVTVSAVNQFDGTGVQDVDEFGDPIISDASNPEVLDPSLPGINNDTYIRKRLSGNFSFRSAKSLLTASIYDERRFYQISDDRERSYGASANLTWDFARRTKAIFSTSGQIVNVRGGGRKDGYASLSAGVVRQLQKKLTGTMKLTHNRRDSSLNSVDYRQNIATIGINWQL